jgi:hypothetical protein
MNGLVATITRSAPLRLGARIVVLTIVALPLVTVARALQLQTPRVSVPAAVALLAGFIYLEAVVLMLVTRVFRTVP